MNGRILVNALLTDLVHSDWTGATLNRLSAVFTQRGGEEFARVDCDGERFLENGPLTLAINRFVLEVPDDLELELYLSFGLLRVIGPLSSNRGAAKMYPRGDDLSALYFSMPDDEPMVQLFKRLFDNCISLDLAAEDEWENKRHYQQVTRVLRQVYYHD